MGLVAVFVVGSSPSLVSASASASASVSAASLSAHRAFPFTAAVKGAEDSTHDEPEGATKLCFSVVTCEPSDGDGAAMSLAGTGLHLAICRGRAGVLI